MYGGGSKAVIRSLGTQMARGSLRWFAKVPCYPSGSESTGTPRGGSGVGGGLGGVGEWVEVSDEEHAGTVCDGASAS